MELLVGAGEVANADLVAPSFFSSSLTRWKSPSFSRRSRSATPARIFSRKSTCEEMKRWPRATATAALGSCTGLPLRPQAFAKSAARAALLRLGRRRSWTVAGDRLVGMLDDDRRDRFVLGLHFPDDVVLEYTLDDGVVGLERLLHRGGQRASFVVSAAKTNRSLLVRDRQFVIGHDHGAIAQVADQVLANVDAGPVWIVADAVDRVVERSLDPSPNNSSKSVLNRSKAVLISQFKLVKLTTSRGTQSGGLVGLALGKSSMPIAFS